VYSATFRTNIKASYDKLWEILLDEMEHPENYSPNVLESCILERFPGGLLRKVAVPDAEVREKFTYDYEKKILSASIVGHPHIVGTTKKTITSDPDHPTHWILESSLEWQTIDDKVDAMLRRNVANFVMEGLEKVKNKAES
jgi:hypothetical protein